MSVSLLIGSTGEGISDLVVLRKKYLGGCQISSSKLNLGILTKSGFQSSLGLILLN